MSASTAGLRDTYEDYLVRYADYAYLVLRVGLAAVVLLAGVHKLVSPDAWTRFFAPWFESLWPTSVVSLELLVLLEGVGEVLLGTALLVGWYTSIVAGIWALSMVTIVIDLATGALMTGEHVTVLIRDLGLVALSFGVALLAAERRRGRR